VPQGANRLTAPQLADCPRRPGCASTSRPVRACRDESYLTCLVFVAAVASALPELETLRKKLGEAENQLKARDEERSRLQKVEGELNATVKQLTSSAAALKQEHEAELTPTQPCPKS